MGFDVIGLITVVLAIIGVGVKLELGNRKLGGRIGKMRDELRGYGNRAIDSATRRWKPAWASFVVSSTSS